MKCTLKIEKKNHLKKKKKKTWKRCRIEKAPFYSFLLGNWLNRF
jgi:hypothetical protein